MTRHLTEDEICRAIAGQSTLDEQRHVVACPECFDQITRSRAMFAAFRHEATVRADRATAGNVPAFPVATSGARQPAWLLAGSALLVAAALLTWQARTPPPDVPQQTEVPHYAGSGIDRSTDWPMDAAEDFYPLEYSTLPVVRGRIVRIEVPQSAPIAFGLDPVGLERTRGNAVLADVVVGEDGLARAVRFVRRPANNY